MRKGKISRASGRGALVILTGLLIGSALLRAGGNAGQALARTDEGIQVSELGHMSKPQACEQPEDFRVMLDMFQSREKRIEQKEGIISDRLKALALADEEVSQKLAALIEAEAQLRSTIALADDAAEGDLVRLTKVYESMKPKQAAALFEEMDPNFAAGFLGRMRPESAAEIMAGLSPAAAHMFSVVLAGRNAEVPRK